jgi:hypothetical protein
MIRLMILLVIWLLINSSVSSWSFKVGGCSNSMNDRLDIAKVQDIA